MPLPLQQFACTLEGLRIRRYRFGGRFERVLCEMEARNRWSTDELYAFRDRRLRFFLSNYVSRSTYYSGVAARGGFSWLSIHTLGDLRVAPVLTKAIVQEQAQLFRPETVSNAQCQVIRTSGTTGAGLHLWTTRAAEQERWAVCWRYRRWHGIPLDAWSGHFGGRSMVDPGQDAAPFWRINYAGRQVLFSCYHLGPESAPTYLGEIRAKRLRWLHGYPSFLAALASYSLDLRWDVGETIQWITTSSENLTEAETALRNDRGGGEHF